MTNAQATAVETPTHAASATTACMRVDEKLRQTFLPPSNAPHGGRRGGAANEQKGTFWYTVQGQMTDTRHNPFILANIQVCICIKYCNNSHIKRCIYPPVCSGGCLSRSCYVSTLLNQYSTRTVQEMEWVVEIKILPGPPDHPQRGRPQGEEPSAGDADV